MITQVIGALPMNTTIKVKATVNVALQIANVTFMKAMPLRCNIEKEISSVHD